MDVERARSGGARLILDVIERLEAGVIALSRRTVSVHLCAAAAKEEAHRLDAVARRIHDRVRGLYPPHAYRIWMARADCVEDDVGGTKLQPGTGFAEPAPQPGAGLKRHAIEVITGDGRIRITELQSEGSGR